MSQSNLQTWLREGIAAAKAGQRERARQILKRIIERDNTNISAWLWLSSVVDNPHHRRICLQRVLKLDPDNQSARAGLARLERQIVPKPAVSLIKKEAAERPPGHDSQEHCPFCEHPLPLTAADCNHCHLPLVMDCPNCDTGVDVEQETCPQCAYSMGDFHRRAGYFLGLAAAYQERQQYHRVLIACQAANRLAADPLRLNLYLGQAQAGLGRTEMAISSLQKVLAQDAGHLPAVLTLGEVFHHLHQWEDARAVYTQALALSPKVSQIQFALGWLLMEQGQVEQAIIHIRETTTLDPQHGQAWLRLGQLYEFSKQYQLATQAYRQAVTLLPADTVAYQRVQERLAILRPVIPEAMVRGWSELIRHIVGPILICVVAALLDSGLRISGPGWVALLLAVPGAFLWASGIGAAQNPLIRLVVGEPGLSSPAARLTGVWLGGGCWLLGLGIILLPLGQSLPEAPFL